MKAAVKTGTAAEEEKRDRKMETNGMRKKCLFVFTQLFLFIFFALQQEIANVSLKESKHNSNFMLSSFRLPK